MDGRSGDPADGLPGGSPDGTRSSSSRLVRTADGSRTRHSARYGETFHSVHGARREALHVYLEASGVGERLDAGERVRVLEIGFGLALNYLVTADRTLIARRHGKNAALDYHAVEHELQSAATIAALGHDAHLRYPAPLAALLDALERRTRPNDTLPGAVHRGTPGTARADTVSRSDLHRHPDDAQVPGRLGADRAAELDGGPLDSGSAVGLSVHVGEASGFRYACGAFDAVYLDAFSPPVNPECWTPVFLATLHATLRPGGTLVSYCVRGEVRRALQAAGFAVERRPGPPGKRQTLLATRLS